MHKNKILAGSVTEYNQQTTSCQLFKQLLVLQCSASAAWLESLSY